MLGPLVAQMSTHRSGSLAATRVVSRNPLATSRRRAAGDSTWATAPMRAVAASCGRWLANAATWSCSSGSSMSGRPPRSRTNEVSRRSAWWSTCGAGVSTQAAPWNRSTRAARAPAPPTRPWDDRG